jgi:hypothetical protein
MKKFLGPGFSLDAKKKKLQGTFVAALYIAYT